MAILIYDNLPFPDSDLNIRSQNTAIGKFMTAWSQIEVICGFLFRELSSIDQSIGRIVFDRIGVKEQVEILIEIAEELEDDTHRKSMIGLLNETREVSVIRNKVVHSRWGRFNGETAKFWHGITSDHANEMVKETAKGEAARRRFVFTVAEINNLVERCITLRGKLLALHGTLLQIQLSQFQQADAAKRWAIPRRHPALRAR